MMITTTTTVTFKMPEEHKQEQKFRLHHNMDEWTEVNDSGYVSYKKAESFIWRFDGERERSDGNS